MINVPSSPKKPAGSRMLNEKAWVRSKATAWDATWHTLTPNARRVFLEDLKGPARPGSGQVSASAASFDPKVIGELAAAGFVRLEPGIGKRGDRVVPLDGVYDFASRARALRRYHLLDKPDLDSLSRFVKFTYHDGGQKALANVLKQTDSRSYHDLNTALEVYVMSSQGPRLAARACGSKLAEPLVEALLKVPGAVPVVEVPGLLAPVNPSLVVEALDELLVNLGLFEGIDPKTFDIVVGLLPVARQRLEAAEKVQTRPTLVVPAKLKETASASGMAINDLRVFLLEVASHPPRLKQDGELYSKEEPRFLAALPEWPAWLYEFTRLVPLMRITQAFHLTRLLGLTAIDQGGDSPTVLHLSGKGRTWLASGLDEQYDFVYEHYRKPKRVSAPRYYDDYTEQADTTFLGLNLIAQPIKGPRKLGYGYSEVKPEDRLALRDAFHKALATLPIGEFVTVESLVEYLTFKNFNPILAGKAPGEVSITIDYRAVANLPEALLAAGKHALDHLLGLRLIPLEAMQVAVDDRDRICVARLDRLDAYFGKPYKKVSTTTSTETRVIVQPDFSVYVIGLNPAPAAELAPFCERTSGQAGQGSLTFKITRASVIRAASQSLSASAIVARLKKHASIGVPDNVVSEVQEWANWIRQVNVKPMTVVRCPDRETVGRVVSALGKKAERLSDSLVALHVARLTTADRYRLQEQGVIITLKDIAVVPIPKLKPASTEPAEKTADTTSPVKKPRGRPRKVR